MRDAGHPFAVLPDLGPLLYGKTGNLRFFTESEGQQGVLYGIRPDDEDLVLSVFHDFT